MTDKAEEVIKHTEDTLKELTEGKAKGAVYVVAGLIFMVVVMFVIKAAKASASNASTTAGPLSFSGGAAQSGGNSTDGSVTNSDANTSALTTLQDTLSAQLGYNQGMAALGLSTAAGQEAQNVTNAADALQQQENSYNFMFGSNTDALSATNGGSPLSSTLLGSTGRNANILQNTKTPGIVGAVKSLFSPGTIDNGNSSGLPAEDTSVLGKLSNTPFGNLFAAQEAPTLLSNSIAQENAKLTTTLQQGIANNSASNQINMLMAQGNEQRATIAAQETANQNLLNSQKKSTCKTFLGFGCGSQGFVSAWSGAADTAVTAATGGTVTPRDNGNGSAISAIGSIFQSRGSSGNPGYTPSYVPTIKISPITNSSGSGSTSGSLLDYNYTPTSDPFNIQNILNGSSASNPVYA